MGHWDAAVATRITYNCLDTVELAVLLLALKKVEHTFYKVIDVQQLKLCRTVIDCERLVIGHSPAESGDCGVVLGFGMAHQVREPVDGYLGTGFRTIIEEQLLPCFLGSAVFTVTESS